MPYWAKDPKTLGLKLINARSETMLTNGAFRDARRCLVIADGFYEWEKRPGEPKQPWWVTRADGEPFAFAGLWSSWRPADGVEPLRTVAIVTTDGLRAARPRARPHAGDAPARRRGRVAGPRHRAAGAARAAACRSSETGMRAVGDAVNDARHDEPDCLEPAAAAAHSVLSVAFSMTTGERRALLGVDRSRPMRCATSMPRTTPPDERVVGRQPGVGAR